jgi:ATP-dependent Lhr-like helicase
VQKKPYDILLHQLLSIVKGHSGIERQKLIKDLQGNFAFQEITVEEIELIIAHLLGTGFLEQIRSELIIGIDGERTVNSRDFYSVFNTEENFKVVNAGSTIGEIPFSPMVIDDQNILLAARIWKIRSVDMKAKRIEVIKALDGKKPMFFGSGGSAHPEIRKKMLEILLSNKTYDLLDEAAMNQVQEMRQEFACYNFTDLATQRPLLRNDKDLALFAFSGSVINRTLTFVMSLGNIPSNLDADSTEIDIKMDYDAFQEQWKQLYNKFGDVDSHLNTLIETNPAVMDFSKWMVHLPREFQIALINTQWFDMEGTKQFVNDCTFVLNTGN